MPGTDLPGVAVLLSTYNGARYLPEQLASLKAQRGVTLRLHARDDGSTDDTCAILRAHAPIWPELATVTSGPNMGAAASFLHLLQSAPDDVAYYAFCDQDDVWMPDKLARGIAALEKKTGPALYCSNMTCVAEDLRPLGVPQAHVDTRLQHLLFENIATGCTIVLNAEARALINSRSPMRGVVMHDWWCALVLAALGEIVYDPEPSLLYRQHGGNLIGLDANLMVQRVKIAMRLFRDVRAFYSIHAQAAQLLELYAEQMPSPNAAAVERLVASKRSWRSRAAYALSGPVVHRDFAGALVARGLILAGWF